MKVQLFLSRKGIMDRDSKTGTIADREREERIMKREGRKDREHMNGEKRGRLRLIAAILGITVVISACGGASAGKASLSAEAPAADYAYDTAAAYDGGVVLRNGPAMTSNQYEAAEEEIAETGEGGSTQEAAAASGRKLIKTVNISAETEDFDALVPSLQKQVEALGGYIESISVYDVGSYYVEEQNVKQRCANLTARVPKEKLDGFLTQVGEQTNVTSRSENVEDVTLQYVDLESHKKALLTEQDRLLTLLGQAESVEDIIAIEGRLSEVRYQLESMESQLRTYDNQIDYSTVYLNIDEVRKYSAPQTASAWERIRSGFVKSIEDIGFGIRDFAIGFVIDIPYLVFWGVIIVVAVFIFRTVRKAWRKRRAKRATADGDNKTEQGRRIRFRLPVTVKTEQDGTEAGAGQDTNQE